MTFPLRYCFTQLLLAAFHSANKRPLKTLIKNTSGLLVTIKTRTIKINKQTKTKRKSNIKNLFFVSYFLFPPPPFDKLSARGSSDVTVGDVGQLWTSLGLERQRLDDLLELVSIATATGETTTFPGESDEPKEELEANKETRFDPATVVDWNKLLALAAGQLGDVNKSFFFLL